MRSGLFGQVLPRIGLHNARTLASGETWSLWEALEDRALGQREQLLLLYLDSRASWTVLKDAVDRSRSVQRKPKRKRPGEMWSWPLETAHG